MGKNKKTTFLTYRKQLLGLAKLYSIDEIKNYFKSKKKLTTSQLELLLIKNKIKLPIKKSFLKSKISKIYLKEIYYMLATCVIVIGFFGGIPQILEIIKKMEPTTIEKISVDKVAKLESDQIKKKSEKTLIDDAKEQQEGENLVSLNAETIITVFDDVNHDLSKIRRTKKVKPIFISLLPKDLDSVKDIEERKELFIKIVLPLIIDSNNSIKSDRKKLFNILNKKNNSAVEKKWLRKKFKEYKINNKDIAVLKRRMDIVPVSLAIAQAAKETGWGTSRFALEGNALYGQWTWGNDGIDPNEKDSTKSHKIKRFKILKMSIESYKNNLNTHSGYQEFREVRAELREKKQEITGLKLTKYLNRYAKTGKKYTKIIQLIIKQNSLDDFDKARLIPKTLTKEFIL